ncbi:DUF4083 domain-containing protein [Metabacillus fastidiosus]|uniref:DUF4083 domain-containing protein n=1 Tax=Metabacillus fastidiosus TaxID=1458 RepID=UPI002EB3DEA5|nr:DUF4083 domain-containing protein [Metabacillus fastidiosus]
MVVQLFYFGFLLFIIVLIISFFLRSNKKRNSQLDRMEKKLDELIEQLKKYER